MAGEGEWKRKVHGASYRRRWIIVHLITDPKSGEIMDILVTLSSCDDIDAGLVLVNRMPDYVKRLSGDGLYDGSRLRRMAYEKMAIHSCTSALSCKATRRDLPEGAE